MKTGEAQVSEGSNPSLSAKPILVFGFKDNRDKIVTMGQYKVPQNVEAEDKILGPFSFRQFIYLLVAAAAGAGVWVLGMAFWPLALIPLPIMLAALALALPLRKDQPMETWLLAMIRFLFIPKKRLWSSDGSSPLIEIDATPVNDAPPLKDIRGQEASNRLSFLAQVLDTGGWSTLGETAAPIVNSNIDEDAAIKAVGEADRQDMFENNNRVNQSISMRLSGVPVPTIDQPVTNPDGYGRIG
ncbi:hypothetical protein FACS189431_3360 [Alphaproteobacteria bacterium]|nr:hypothetical protein FACS189431_3360 [Alphaproteobacteria bacterium]